MSKETGDERTILQKKQDFIRNLIEANYTRGDIPEDDIDSFIGSLIIVLNRIKSLANPVSNQEIEKLILNLYTYTKYNDTFFLYKEAFKDKGRKEETYSISLVKDASFLDLGYYPRDWTMSAKMIAFRLVKSTTGANYTGCVIFTNASLKEYFNIE